METKSRAELAGRPTYTRAQLDEYFDVIALPVERRRYSLTSSSSSSSSSTSSGNEQGKEDGGAADGDKADDDDEKSKDKEDLEYLSLILKHHLVRIPFENLTQHYSWHKVVDPRPAHVFNKMVAGSRRPKTVDEERAGDDDHDDDGGSSAAVPKGGGRGGYCMEVNSLLHTVLLSIGFDVYFAGARIWSAPLEKYTGISHCINLVTIGGVRYLVDTGFGPNGATRPLPLLAAGGDGDGAGGGDDGEHEHDQIPPAKMRLLRQPIRQGLSRQPGWIYQVCYGGDAQGRELKKKQYKKRMMDDGGEGQELEEDHWITQYMFNDAELLLEDITVLNMYPGTSRSSFFTQTVLCVRFTTDEEVGPGGRYDDVEEQTDGQKTPKKEFPGRVETRALQHGRIDGSLILWGDVFKWRRNGRTVLERKVQSDPDRLDILEKYFGIVLDEDDIQGIRGTAGALGGL